MDAITFPTFMGGVATEIVEDFQISEPEPAGFTSVAIEVPEGATQLFVAAPDAVAACCLAFGSMCWTWGPGLLCGGWAFELCIYLRAVLARLESFTEGGTRAADQLLLQLSVMSAWLIVVTLAFAFSVELCIRARRSERGSSQLKPAKVETRRS